MSKKLMLSDSKMEEFGQMIAEGVKTDIIRQKFGIGENKFYELRNLLIASGKLVKGAKNTMLFPRVIGDDRVMQTISGSKRVITFGDQWKPERAMTCVSKSGVGSGLGLTMPCPE